LKKEKNFNKTGKSLFVLYECPDCGRTDCSCVPPKMEFNIPFFVTCDCGGYVIYQQAWITEPYHPTEVLTAWIVGDNTILKELRIGGKFKEVTDQLDPDGTMVHISPESVTPEMLKEAERRIKDRESKERMYH